MKEPATSAVVQPGRIRPNKPRPQTAGPGVRRPAPGGFPSTRRPQTAGASVGKRRPKTAGGRRKDAAEFLRSNERLKRTMKLVELVQAKYEKVRGIRRHTSYSATLNFSKKLNHSTTHNPLQTFTGQSSRLERGAGQGSEGEQHSPVLDKGGDPPHCPLPFFHRPDEHRVHQLQGRRVGAARDVWRGRGGALDGSRHPQAPARARSVAPPPQGEKKRGEKRRRAEHCLLISSSCL